MLMLGALNFSFWRSLIVLALEVVDVTRRYTASWEDVRTRRTLVREDEVAQILKGINAQLALELPEKARWALLKRRAKVQTI